MQRASWAQPLDSQDSVHCKRIPKIYVVVSRPKGESRVHSLGVGLQLTEFVSLYLEE